MSKLNIQTCLPREVTIISNEFLDRYMLDANGEFVKIYLYLLRATTKPEPSLDLSTIADTLSCTEKDILRALKYWAKSGIMQIDFDENKELKNIIFLDMAPQSAPQSATPVSSINKETKEPPQKLSLSAGRVKELKSNEDIMQLLFIAEQYLGKTLSSTDTMRLLYFYEELHFSTDLIEYLVEYCVSKNHKSMHYIEKVALAWHEEGISSVTAAKRASASYHKDYYAILKALGISGRSPIQAEIDIMKTWKESYGFSMELITEACTRTILATKQPSFQYADSILSRWKKEGVQSLADIAKLDLKHNQLRETKEAVKTKPAANNKFNNFEQRPHNFTSLERQLLN